MNKLTTGVRVGTMLLDHFIMIPVVMLFVLPGLISDMSQPFTDANGQSNLLFGNRILSIFGVSLYLNKDIFLGRSPAKHILKLQVIDLKTNGPANPIKCLARNITIAIWPIEVIAGLINKERRIGDFIAGTQLTVYNPEQHKAKPHLILIIVALLAAMLVAYFIVFYPSYLLGKWMANIGS